MTSRSNWAKESSTLSINRPIEVVVLICWVTALKLTSCAVEHVDHLGEVGEAAR